MTEIKTANTFELGCDVMKRAECFVSL